MLILLSILCYCGVGVIMADVIRTGAKVPFWFYLALSVPLWPVIILAKITYQIFYKIMEVN